MCKGTGARVCVIELKGGGAEITNNTDAYSYRSGYVRPIVFFTLIGVKVMCRRPVCCTVSHKELDISAANVQRLT